jgi:FkbM family methyltransferase
MPEIKINDLLIKYHNNSTDMGVITEIFSEDPYKFLSIPDNALIIDIGAHIGTFSLRCAKEKNCLVYAYEPCEENYKLLCENIHNNSLSDKISAFRMAVSNKIGMREFYVDAYHYSGSSFYLKYFSDKKTFGRPFHAEMVKCTTPKQIFDDNKITHCNVLKIDCELEEKNILLDPETSEILEKVDVIIVEFHCLPYGKSIAEHLRNRGFSIHCNNQFLFEGGIIRATKGDII